jgi:hypothetical protein
MHNYEVRPRRDHRGVDLISDALPFGRLWYGEPNAVANAIGYAKHRSRSHDAMIRVYDEAGNVIETQRAQGQFKGEVKFYDTKSTASLTYAVDWREMWLREEKSNRSPRSIATQRDSSASNTNRSDPRWI